MRYLDGLSSARRDFRPTEHRQFDRQSKLRSLVPLNRSSNAVSFQFDIESLTARQLREKKSSTTGRDWTRMSSNRTGWVFPSGALETSQGGRKDRRVLTEGNEGGLNCDFGV